MPLPAPLSPGGGGECDHGKKIGVETPALNGGFVLCCSSGAPPQPPHPATPRGLGVRTGVPRCAKVCDGHGGGVHSWAAVCNAARNRAKPCNAAQCRAKPQSCRTPRGIAALCDVTGSCATPCSAVELRATSCNVMQRHATSCSVMQRHAMTHEAVQGCVWRRDVHSIRALLRVRVSPCHNAAVVLSHALPSCPRVAPHIPVSLSHRRVAPCP